MNTKVFFILICFYLFGIFTFSTDATRLPTVERNLNQAIHYHPTAPNRVGYLYVGNHETAISQSTWLYIKQALIEYQKNRPIFIILELDTPGGEAFEAQKIVDSLREVDRQFNISIFAYINN